MHYLWRFGIITVTFVISMIAAVALRSQEPFCFHYSPINGLSSSNIYDITQDSVGRIWLATENGVTCYDGYEFRNIQMPAGLPDNSFIKLYQGRGDRIWFISYGGYLAYTSHGTLKNFPLNDSLQKYGHRYFVNTLFIDSCDRVYCKAKESGKVLLIDQELKLHIIDSASFPARIYTPFFSEFHHRKISHVVPIDSMNQARATDGTVWTRNENGGLTIRKGETRGVQEILRNSRVTRVFQDREDHYWIATEGNGLFYLPSIRMNISYPPDPYENRNILDFCIHDDRLLFSTAEGKLFSATMEAGHLKNSRELLTNEPLKFIRSILVSKAGDLWLTQSKYLRYDLNGVKRPLPYIILVKYYEIYESDDRSIFLATREGFVEYRNGRLVYDSRRDNFDGHTFSIVKMGDGTLYLGAINGLFSFDNQGYHDLGLTDQRYRERVKVVRRWGDYLVAGTTSAGVIITGKDGRISVLNMANGLPSQRVEEVFRGNDSTLWIGTDQGLSQAIRRSDGLWRVRNFSIWDGLPSNEIHRIAGSEEFIWVATSSGIASFKPGEIIPRSPGPTIFIDHLLVNDRDSIYPENASLKLQPGQRTLNIFYKGILFTDHERLSYEYRMENYDSTWIPTRNLSARYSSLPPGTYRFLVRSVDGNGRYSESIATVSFLIRPFIYETWYFYLFIGVILLAAIVGFVLLAIRMIERRSKFRSDFLWNQQKALRLQMNPHFIFNALNSVQHFIISKDEEAAGLYLSRFSKLMRRVLDNSRHNLIALEEELVTIDLYLKLEKVRFEDKFEYVIDVDPSLDCTEVKIPPMLIQPFLENAIRHGLANSLQKGLLKLRFERSGRMMRVTVEDNGIGIIASREINARRQGHQSSGMKNIEERIGMLNQLMDRTIDLKVTELQEIAPDLTGTRIELIIPLFASENESCWTNFRNLWRKK